MARKKKSRTSLLRWLPLGGSKSNLLKNSGRKLLLLLAAMLFVWLAVTIKQDVRSDPRFQLAHWSFNPGNLPAWVTPEIREEIMNDFNSEKSKLTFFDQEVLSRLKEILERSPWIREVVDIGLVYPTPERHGQVRAVMILSTPVALVSADNRWYLSDSRGRRLGERYSVDARTRAWFKLPIIEGIEPHIPRSGYAWTSNPVLDGISVASALHRERIGERYPDNPIESIDISNAGGGVDGSASEINLLDRIGRTLEWGRASTSRSHKVLSIEAKLANLHRVQTESRYWRRRRIRLYTPDILQVRSDPDGQNY
tara:strand:- start:488 stop:1420 length:933 start_codon:yes stop_codon:yes gene_type:complete